MLKTVYKEIERPALDEMVNKIVSEYGPVQKIILFGSRVRGQADEYSDTDLIVVKETSEGFVRRLVNLPPLPARTDVFVYTPREFASMQRNKNPFIVKALASAHLLYPYEK